MPGETARSSRTSVASLKPLNALRNFWLSDRTLNQYEELASGFVSASWWTQDWWSDNNLCADNAINECLNRLIQSRHPSFRQTFWLVCHEEVESLLNFRIIFPYDGFSALIAEFFFSSRLSYCMICFRTNTCREPSLWFCPWRMLNFCPCEFSSEFCIEVLIWDNRDFDLLVKAADSILVKWNCWHLLFS